MSMYCGTLVHVCVAFVHVYVWLTKMSTFCGTFVHVCVSFVHVYVWLKNVHVLWDLYPCLCGFCPCVCVAKKLSMYCGTFVHEYVWLLSIYIHNSHTKHGQNGPIRTEDDQVTCSHWLILAQVDQWQYHPKPHPQDGHFHGQWQKTLGLGIGHIIVGLINCSCSNELEPHETCFGQIFWHVLCV